MMAAPNRLQLIAAGALSRPVTANVSRYNQPQKMINPLLARYPIAQRRYDELFVSDFKPRPHWRAMLQHLSEQPPGQMRRRIDALQRQVRENGVTYNIYADPKGMERPWDLNVIPFILPRDEWSEIEAAVIQRATLLNRVLGDVYGDQTLLREGLLPSQLIHGNAGFLRPCHGMRLHDDIALHFYAVDLARAPNGRWWVVADRTQAPSGAGYALENRIVIARAFPELFRDLKVEHLAAFFATLRDSLAHWGRICAANRGDGADTSPPLHDTEQPLIVLLTPGPFNETYYEQTYLARYLGFPLVEGGDLTVRNGLVWLKTLGGPRRVHVILRRVDDAFCDPLELRSDSALGVAGLTEAARRGTVLIANGLGAALLESGALLGYLPAICRRMLGEELKMPSVATWWCGEPAALRDVIAGLDHLVVKPAFPQLRQFPVFGEDLGEDARRRFIETLRADPQNYVAQELVRISQAPVWQEHPEPGIGAAATGMRVFACATPSGYIVMPGGLTRVATGTDARVITMQRGGASKDTWIQSRGRVNKFSLLLRSDAPHELIRGDTLLSSRMVENLFWFGRYTERCDNSARLIRSALDYLSNVSPQYRGGEWPALQALCEWFELVRSGPALPDGATALDDRDTETALLKAVLDRTVPGLAANLHQLYRVASHLRERLSLDNWRTLNQLVQQHGGDAVGHSNGSTTGRTAAGSADEQAGNSATLAGAVTRLDDATSALMTLTGFALDGMTRDSGWRFMSIGRRLERLQFLCTLLQSGLRMPPNSSLDWLLDIADSIVTYRSRYMAQPEWLPVLDLLVTDDSNPRSIVFQLLGLIKFLDRLASAHGDCGAALFVPLLVELQALKPARDLHWGSTALVSLLERMGAASVALSERLGLQFFSHTGEVSQGSFAP